jgi:hypothetical protein
MDTETMRRIVIAGQENDEKKTSFSRKLAISSEREREDDKKSFDSARAEA